MTIYLEDGFDDGTFDAWDFTSNIQVTTNSAYVHSGTHGAIEDGGGTSYVGTTVSATKAYIYCKFWFKIYHDAMSDTDYDRLAETYEVGASLFLLRLTIYKDGDDMKLRSQIRHQTGGAGGDVTVTLDTEVLNLNQWYCVEYLCFAGTGGTDKVWLDEREVASVVCAYDGYTMENSFIFPAGYLWDFNLRAIDDCIYSDSYNGCALGYSGGPYIKLDEEKIHSKTESPKCIFPFNLPYARMAQNLSVICKAAFDAAYEPWEWWIDDDGYINFDEGRGADLSATIRFVAREVVSPDGCDVHMGTTSKSLDSKRSVQRVKLTGKSSGKRQDEVSSNWQLDEASMILAGTFYEEVISEKTVTGRPTINEWARVYLEKLKAIVQEIEVTIERDPYLAGSWDVADDVWLYDPKSRIDAGAYRIKRINCRVDSGGEHITLTVTNSWQDITDAIADIYRKIKQMQMTGMGVEDWTAGGSEQGKGQAKEMENLWSINKEYEVANEFGEPKEDDPNNSDSYWCNANYPNGATGEDIRVRQDELTIEGSDTAHGGVQRTEAIATRMRMTDWDESPRFHVRLLMKGLDGEELDLDDCMQSTDDYVNFGIINSQSGAPASLFMFQIECTHVANQTYNVIVMVNFNNSGLIQRTVKEITAGVMHDYEVRVDWESKYVLFYIDNKPVAVFPIDISCSGSEPDDMELMYIIANMTSSVDCQPVLEFFTWKTQVKTVGKFEEST